MDGGIVESDGPFAEQERGWEHYCSEENRFCGYGVWLPRYSLAVAHWFVVGDSGLVFRTYYLGYARAMAKACGGEPKEIGGDGEPVDLPE